MLTFMDKFREISNILDWRNNSALLILNCLWNINLTKLFFNFINFFSKCKVPVIGSSSSPPLTPFSVYSITVHATETPAWVYLGERGGGTKCGVRSIEAIFYSRFHIYNRSLQSNYLFDILFWRVLTTTINYCAPASVQSPGTRVLWQGERSVLTAAVEAATGF